MQIWKMNYQIRFRGDVPARNRIDDRSFALATHPVDPPLPSHPARVYGDDRELVLRAPEPVEVEGDRWTLA